MLGNRLRARREELQLTLEELAQDIGVHWTQVQKWEKGRVLPNGKYLKLLCQRLRISSDYLLELVDEPQDRLPIPSKPDEQDPAISDAIEQGDIFRLLHLISTDEDFIDRVAKNFGTKPKPNSDRKPATP